ncbi:hypothetical protein SIO17_14525 [Pseudoalteromonas piscicida]|uniref:GAF domain-containing protein n=1 Tax=Pseudoalteromonas piscicida TaxID=43662 RepID=A0ABN5CHU3_PSEO7|nr:hypothetical protein [Pseudoalteromonas piscicida]ATD08271.1 hypothetical protein PPIS_a3488 [Pseudoalteromonas piscicida]WPU30322.1 hypothetical protein SIO17_14525 [Pseudoalteromonas piscicida]
MNNTILSAYEKQLPKHKPITFWPIFGRFAATVGIFTGTASFFYSPESIQEYVFSTFLCLTVIFLIGYIFYRESQKHHRYSESIVFLAHSSHLMKDYLQELRYGRVEKEEFHRLYTQLADAISKCFTLLKGRRCSVCIKTLSPDGELQTHARDANSSVRYSDVRNSIDVKHFLSDNTDFELLFGDNNEYGRYFLDNNLKDRWLNRNYKNSSFSVVGEPLIKSRVFRRPKVSNWRLGYQSTLVCPIRHITTKEFADGEYKHYWGFLCIDSESRNVFNKNIDPELAYCFANQLYLLSAQIREMDKLNEEISELYTMIDEVTKPIAR